MHTIARAHMQNCKINTMMEFRRKYIGIRIRVNYTRYYLVQCCGLHLMMFPVLLDPAPPLDAPPYTRFV
jgi:hypothetical protein